jgi:hypothetical protein
MAEEQKAQEEKEKITENMDKRRKMYLMQLGVVRKYTLLF